MTSDAPDTAYVWIWLPDHTEPVVAGRLDRRPGQGHNGADRFEFVYGRSYLDRPNAVPIYAPELPLDDRVHLPLDGDMPLCIDDTAPDSWGRAVINTKLGRPGDELDPLTYLLESGSDRVGALDYQRSPSHYSPRNPVHAPIEQLQHFADLVASGEAVDPDLADALAHGTPLGGARPKALIRDNGIAKLAKFSKSTETFLWVQSEYVAMTLARRVGINAAAVEYLETAGRSTLLVDRFDRHPNGTRQRVVSAATILGMQSMIAARHFSYIELADEIRARFVNPADTLRELYGRIVFNILVGNTDDHARNHAAFILSDNLLDLTPAYDIAPQPRTGGTATHPRFGPADDGRDSRISAVLKAAPVYLLSEADARDIIESQRTIIERDWDEVCDAAHLTKAQRDTLRDGGPILHPAIDYN